MICTSIQNHGLEEILDMLDNGSPAIRMAEIRLDRCPLDEEGIAELFSCSDTPLVATCRVAGDGNGTWEEAEAKLSCAIEAGAAFVDLEIEAPKEMGKRLRRACNEYGTTMVCSCHFFDGVPSLEVLLDTAGKCRRFGGEIIKIVGMARSDEDARRLMRLYDFEAPERLVAFAMGEYGRESRLECLRKGAPFTYAALASGEGTAPGQWTCSEMASAVYGDRKPLGSGLIPSGGASQADAASHVLDMPASKSFAQRAIIAAALAGGVSRLEGYSPCGDNEAALDVARALGAEVSTEGSTIVIKGASQPLKSLSQSLDAHFTPSPATEVPEMATIHVGESGLLTRLMIPLVAALQGNGSPVGITGEGTLLNRPLKGAAEIMAQFGTLLRPLSPKAGTAADRHPGDADEGIAAKEYVGVSDRALGGIKVPLSVQGPLLAGKADVSGRDGSQLISGLLMALPLLQADSVIHVHHPKSIPYMFVTMDVLKRFGIRIGSEMEGDEEFMETQDWRYCTGITFKIKGGQEYHPADFEIEGDWSAAANFMVAGAVFGKVRLQGLDTTSLQADISIMDILMEAGASLSQLTSPSPDEFPVDGSEPLPEGFPGPMPDNQAEGEQGRNRGIVTVQRAPLRALDIDLNNCPDLFPIVSVLAAFCNGRSHLQGFKRLASKESDRGKAILEMLEKMGVAASAEGDVLTVDGETLESRLLNGRLLRGGEYSSSHDHRMAMALTVASLGAAHKADPGECTDPCHSGAGALSGTDAPMKADAPIEADDPIKVDDTACVAKSFPDFFTIWRQAL